MFVKKEDQYFKKFDKFNKPKKGKSGMFKQLLKKLDPFMLYLYPQSPLGHSIGSQQFGLLHPQPGTTFETQENWKNK